MPGKAVRTILTLQFDRIWFEYQLKPAGRHRNSIDIVYNFMVAFLLVVALKGLLNQNLTLNAPSI